MPTRRRIAVGDMVYHVLNRANARLALFETDGDYLAFEKVMREAEDRALMRTLAYCLMPNHWHMVLWPRADGELSRFMHWLTTAHTKRWHASHQTTGTGHIYQGRFKSFPVESDLHYLTVCRYVERNALRAGLTSRAEEWRWGSLWVRLKGGPDQKMLLSNGPMEWPDNWVELVNEPHSEKEEEALQRSVVRGSPFGSLSWVQMASKRLGLASALRSPGRPRKSR